MDIAHRLAAHVAGAGYEQLPSAVVATTKTFILDTIATIMAGSSDASCQEIVKLIRDWGGNAQSAVLVFGDRLPAVHAAYLNSMLAHALDFDDTYGYDLKTNRRDGGHANSTVVPVCLAAAELRGGVSGKDFITAVAVGVDLMLRLGFTLKQGRGWTRSAICGVFGAAAAAGLLLGLDQRQIFNALGIAFSQASGTQQAIVDKALVKRLQPAAAAKAALFSTLLAQRNITGAEDIFQGKFGFFNMYSAGQYDLDPLFLNLGKTYEGVNLGIKPYPCGRLIHPAMDGALELVREHGIAADEIAEIIVRVPERTFYLVGAPFEISEDLGVRVQFSIPYGMAVAMINRQLSMEDFLDQSRMRDPRIGEFARRVKVVVDNDPQIEYAAKLPVTVEVISKTHGKFIKRVERIHGDPNDPLTPEEFRQKVIACAKYAVNADVAKRVDHIIETTNYLEDVNNILTLISLLT